jgi:hypothetical protein
MRISPVRSFRVGVAGWSPPAGNQFAVGGLDAGTTTAEALAATDISATRFQRRGREEE